MRKDLSIGYVLFVGNYSFLEAIGVINAKTIGMLGIGGKMTKAKPLNNFRRELREAIEKVQRKYDTNGNLYVVMYFIRKVKK